MEEVKEQIEERIEKELAKKLAEDKFKGSQKNIMAKAGSVGGGIPRDDSLRPGDIGGGGAKGNRPEKEGNDNPKGGGLPKDQSLIPEAPKDIEAPKKPSDSDSGERGKNMGDEGENQGREESKDGEKNEDKIAGKLNKDKEKDKKSKIDSKVGVKGGVAGSKPNKLRLMFDKLLQNAWRYILPSFTLSAFWVYVHVFLSGVSPKLFCKLGHEWAPNQMKMSAPEEAKKAGDKVGIAEKGLAGCCCFIHSIVLLIIGGIIFLVVNAIEKVMEWIGWLWDLF